MKVRIWHISNSGDTEIGVIPKRLYFAIFFSLFVEFLNIKMRKTTNQYQYTYNEIEDRN
jgi:hypothetical protein